MPQIPPENRRAADTTPPENQPPPVDEVGGIPLGFERLTAPGPISLSVGVTELAAPGLYTLANGTRNGQEKVIITPMEQTTPLSVAHDFEAHVECNFYIGYNSMGYHPDTTNKRIGLRGPMTFLKLKWVVGVPTEHFGAHDCWVFVGGPGINEFDTETSRVSELTFYRGNEPS